MAIHPNGLRMYLRMYRGSFVAISFFYAVPLPSDFKFVAL